MKKLYKNKYRIILLTLVAAVAVGGALYVRNQNSVKSNTPVGTEKHGGPDTDASAPMSSSANTGAATTNPDHPASSNLAKPTGPNNNVSSVSLSGPSTMMESTCRSVAGASCYIQASMNGKVVKVSDTKAVGSDAYSDGAIFDWDANQLTVGTWSIQAVATKDGSTAASDPQALTVKP